MTRLPLPALFPVPRATGAPRVSAAMVRAWREAGPAALLALLLGTALWLPLRAQTVAPASPIAPPVPATTADPTSPLPANITPARPGAVTTNWGTGFVVAEGYVLTAYHVVQNQPRLAVGPFTGNQWISAELVQSDPKLDLALLRARVNVPALSLAPSAEVPMGLEISVIGYPQPRFQGVSKKITQGIVNGYRSERQNAQDVGMIQISAEISRGNSGGPVIAPDGTVIGMVQRKIDAKKIAEETEDIVVNVNYALRSSQLIRFLQSGPAAPRVQGLSLQTVLRPYQLFEQAQASVLAVTARGPADPRAAPTSPSTAPTLSPSTGPGAASGAP